MITNNFDEIKRGSSAIIPEAQFTKELAKNKSLIVKFGMDPTAPDIHLGHTVILNKLKTLQDMGHQIVLVIGDFTAQVGDPSGKNITRPALSNDEVLAHAQTYTQQVFKILDETKTKVVYNSSWLGKLGSVGLVRLAAKQTVARMLERDDFKKRFQSQKPIAIHEFLYPLLQGYDSVELKADLELGGTDQTFNLLMGRELQKEEKLPEQCVLTMPLLEGLDGQKKMSKSANNYIGINEKPFDMYSKLMSISDELMWRYYELLSFKSLSNIHKLQEEVKSGSYHPKQAKEDLIAEIIERYHSADSFVEAKAQFELQFKHNQIPEDIPHLEIKFDPSIKLAVLLKNCELVKSTSEGIRMIRQGGVKINGEKIINLDHVLTNEDASLLLQIGKRKFAKISWM